MKNKIQFGLFMGMLLGMSPLTSTAQNVQELGRGDTLHMTAPAELRSCKWQVSTDSLNFAFIPNETEKELDVRIFAPGYYRYRGVTSGFKTQYGPTTKVTLKNTKFYRTWESGGGHGFVETMTGEPFADGISIPEDRNGLVEGNRKVLTNWNKQDRRAAYYFHIPKGYVTADMLLKVKKNENLTMKVTVWDPAEMDAPIAENIVAVKGTGETETINFISFAARKEAYYRFQLECLAGNENIIELSKFHHRSSSQRAIWKPGYTNSPSAHLKGWRSTDVDAPRDRAYDWCYLEVMLPKESDYCDTYVMSLGVLDGYMGIQMNNKDRSNPQHNVIFSMWDHGDTDVNPNLPENLRANVVDHGEGVNYERFANEGTGMKSFKGGNCFDCDTFVQFITNCRPEKATYTVVENGDTIQKTQNNTLVSTWFNAQDGKGWQYMATLRLANKSLNFNSWYSFLENFYTAPGGQVQRKGYYRNGYAHSVTKNKWFHCNQVDLGNTDGSGNIGSRDDFGQGICPDAENTFFQTTGGFLPKNSIGPNASLTVPLNADNTPVDTIRTDLLLKRVDLAVKHEKDKIIAKEKFDSERVDKTGWKIVSFSSEEAKGEGDGKMGHADQIIDGIDSTYWHSQWMGETAKYPHVLVVDFAESHYVSGIQLKTSDGGGKRHIKDCNLYLSKDNQTWEQVYAGKDMPDQDVHQILLNQPTEAQYLKIEVTKGFAKEGPFVRINEVDIIEDELNGINAAIASQFDVTCRPQAMLVKSPADLSDADICVYRTDGACIYNAHYATLSAGEIVTIPVLSAPKGIYVVTCHSGDLKMAKQVLWK